MSSRMARTDPPLTELASLNEHIRALIAQDKNLLAEELSLDKLGANPEQPQAGDSVASRAKHFLNGFDSLPSLGLSKGERLYVVRQDRLAIAAALSELERQRQHHLAIEAHATAKANTPRFLSLIKRAALLATEFEAVEAEIAAMRRGMAGLLLPFPEFGHRSIAGVNWSCDPAGTARRALLKAGVLSERDIREAKR